MSQLATTTTTFEVGETYSCRSIGDYECVWAYTIEARTAKFVTIDVWGDRKRLGVKTDRDGVEYVLPHGNYSMATVLRASEVVRRAP